MGSKYFRGGGRNDLRGVESKDLRGVGSKDLRGVVVVELFSSQL